MLPLSSNSQAWYLLRSRKRSRAFFTSSGLFFRRGKMAYLMGARFLWSLRTVRVSPFSRVSTV